MSTSKRYPGKIDADVEARRAANPEPTPPTWHPRTNAFPTRWTLRNGRWGTIFGEIEALDVRRNGLPTTVYMATPISEGGRREPKEFPTGDAAAEALWNHFMRQVRGELP